MLSCPANDLLEREPEDFSAAVAAFHTLAEHLSREHGFSIGQIVDRLASRDSRAPLVRVLEAPIADRLAKAPFYEAKSICFAYLDEFACNELRSWFPPTAEERAPSQREWQPSETQLRAETVWSWRMLDAAEARGAFRGKRGAFDVFVYVALLDIACNSGQWRARARKRHIEVGAAHARLSARTGLSRRTCGTVLKRLEETRLLGRVNRGRRKTGSAEFERTLVRLMPLGVPLGASTDCSEPRSSLYSREGQGSESDKTRPAQRATCGSCSPLSEREDTATLPTPSCGSCLPVEWEAAYPHEGPPCACAAAPWELYLHDTWRSCEYQRAPDVAAARAWVCLVRHGRMSVGQLAGRTSIAKSSLVQEREGKTPPVLRRLVDAGLAACVDIRAVALAA
jgi:hypothetical protein